MAYFFPALVAFVFSATLTKLILSVEQVRRWLVRDPTPDRWHRTSTPSLGGIGMFAAFVICLIVFGEIGIVTWKILLGGACIFLIGLVDDIWSLPPYAKLIGQIAVACLMLFLGVSAKMTGNPLIYIPLTLAWIVGITNAFNLLDNMDGLAGGIALIGTLFVGALTFGADTGVPGPFIAIFAGAIAGFLIFNINPARIFMGDCGSQWLGFTLATLTIAGTWRSASNLFITIATPLLVLAVPIFDTTLVTLNRKFHGRPVSRGGRDHASHRLAALGLSERKTVWIFWSIAILFGVTALFVHLHQLTTWVFVVLGLIICALVFGIFLTDVKVYEGETPPPSAVDKYLPRLNLFSKRRIIDILMDTILIGASYALAYLLRYDWRFSSYTLGQFEKTIPIVLATKISVMFLFGLYRGLWTYIDFESFKKLVQITFLASVTSVIVLLGVYRFEGFSRTLFAIDFAVLLCLMGGSRMMLRTLRESVFAFPESGRRVLVVGAGDAANFLLREIRKYRQWNLRPIALVDDDSRKQGTSILGVPVQGSRRDITRLVTDREIDHVIIAIPSAQPHDRELIEQECRKCGVPYVSMQSLEDSLIRGITGSIH